MRRSRLAIVDTSTGREVTDLLDLAICPWRPVVRRVDIGPGPLYSIAVGHDERTGLYRVACVSTPEWTVLHFPHAAMTAPQADERVARLLQIIDPRDWPVLDTLPAGVASLEITP